MRTSSSWPWAPITTWTRRLASREAPAPYGGSGVCYAEFGDGLVSKVEVNFLSGPAAAAKRFEPSRDYAAEKEEFGATRRARWFGL
jgi:sulfide:quinone oxidoreductase